MNNPPYTRFDNSSLADGDDYIFTFHDLNRTVIGYFNNDSISMGRLSKLPDSGVHQVK